MDSSSTFLKSASSSDDLDHHHHHQVYDESDTTKTTKPKRSYECTYCKRGFTNAQALGGHMNIHRRDRAKAKESNNVVNKSSSSFAKSHEDYSGNTSDNSTRNYYAHEYSDHGDPYNMYHDPSMVAASPSYFYHPPQPMVYYGNDFATPRSNDQDGVCTNLSSRIGSTYLDDQQRVNDDQNDRAVDLELRLGPDP